jgi:hypothetical protein
VGRIHALREGATSADVIREGSGRLDGVEVLRDGGVVFTSWVDSAVHLLRDGKDQRLLREIPEGADIGVDTRRNQLAVPLSVLGRVQIWSLAATGDSTRR